MELEGRRSIGLDGTISPCHAKHQIDCSAEFTGETLPFIIIMILALEW